MLAAVAIFYLSSSALLRWTLRRWLASDPIQHVTLTLKELNDDRGVLEIHPQGSEPFLVPFGLTYTVFAPNASLTVSQTWPELDLGPFVAFNAHADLAVNIPLTGGWRAGGSFVAPALKAKASGELFSGRTDLALTPAGGVASGDALTGKRKATWNLVLGPPDFGTTVPFDIKGKLTFGDESARLEGDVVLVRDGDLVSLKVSCGECGHTETAAGRAWLGPVDFKSTVLAGDKAPTFSLEANLAGGVSTKLVSALPLNARVVAQGELGGAAQFSVGAQSPLLPWRAELKGAVEGWHAGHADFELPLPFTPDLSSRPFWESTLPKLDFSAGKITVTAEAQWKTGTLKSTARVDGRGVEGKWLGLPFEVDTLRLAAELSPTFRQRGPNTLLLKSVGDKITAKKVEVEVGWKDANAFDLKKFTAQFANGRITMFPFTYSVRHRSAHSKLVAEKMDLAVLTPFLLGESAAGRGTMTGDIPWHLDKGTFHLDDAIIHNDGPGHVSYRDATTAHLPEKVDFLDQFNDILAQGQQVLVLKALQNFDFSVLRIRMNRHSENDMKAELDLKGRNPDLAKGQPFEIVLPISGQVEPLIKETIWKGFFGDS